MTDNTKQSATHPVNGSLAALDVARIDAVYTDKVTLSIPVYEQMRAALEQQTAGDDFQNRVAPWMQKCFGPEISADKVERNQRFLEEALELMQANGGSAAEAHALVDYVFARPIGDLSQEVGGVMVTLAALCLASGVNMHDCGEIELTRVWEKIDKIREKQAAKTRYGSNPLTGLATRPAIPEGMALVPIEPTEDMREAGDEEQAAQERRREIGSGPIWRAMIAAAQKGGA